MALHHCPYQCGVVSPELYAIELHVDDCPLNIDPSNPPVHSRPAPPDIDWIVCPRKDCGEHIQLHEIDQHHALHTASDFQHTVRVADVSSTMSDMTSPTAESSKRTSALTQTTSSTARPVSKTGTSLLEYVASSPHPRGPPESRARKLREPLHPGRLGKKELGPHAFEKAMPPDVRRHLIEDALPHYSYRIGQDGKLQRTVTVENETSGLIRTLSDLCALDDEIQVTYLCHPSVKHIHKLACDGNFCGYWNIQMLLSYMQHVDSIPGGLQRIPDVLQIQNTIEQGWDNGLCAYGRVETGGIKGTRKWIGTHEAVTYFMQIGVPIHAMSFREDEKKPAPPQAQSSASSFFSYSASASKSKAKYTTNDVSVIHFLDHIEAYFMSALDDPATKHHRTSFTTPLPPIYFQRQGHSTTIVGLERRKDGFRNLLVFDPSFATSGPVRKLLAGQRTVAKPEVLLRPYRRTDRSLTAWNEFEIVVPKIPTHAAASVAAGSSKG